jgi:hypothetical protein
VRILGSAGLHITNDTRDLKGVTFEVFIAVKIQVKVFWVVMLCNVVVGYQCFGGPP